MDKTRPIVVADTGPIIHLDELECLDLLADFNKIFVPDAVWREVLRHRPQATESQPKLFVRHGALNFSPLVKALTPPPALPQKAWTFRRMARSVC